MGRLSELGRIFFGFAIMGIGIQTVYYNNLPYMLYPPMHLAGSGQLMLVYISGILLILGGISALFLIKPRSISLILGILLLAIFCFSFVPYEFRTNSNYLHLGEWENSEKELALSSGAFLIAACFPRKSKTAAKGFFSSLIPFGSILYALTIVSFGIDHFLYGKEASEYIPSWISHPMFWIYLAGVALIGSGIAIVLKIKTGLFAFLLGFMILIWFVILHVPKVLHASSNEFSGELTSAFLALAYSGIAFVIAGTGKK